MSAVVIAINNHARMHQFFDEVMIPADMLAHSVGNLDNAARRVPIVPTCAGNLQAVRAGELELMGRYKAHDLIQATDLCLPAQKCSRKMRLRTFAEPLLGNSVSEKSMYRGSAMECA